MVAVVRGNIFRANSHCERGRVRPRILTVTRVDGHVGIVNVGVIIDIRDSR